MNKEKQRESQKERVSHLGLQTWVKLAQALILFVNLLHLLPSEAIKMRKHNVTYTS